MTRNMPQRVWLVVHCLIAQFLCFKMIWDKYQCKWFYAHCFVTYFLCIKMFQELSYPTGHVYLYPWTQARVKFYGQNVDNNQRFLIMCASLIFCMRGISRPLNQRFLAIHSSLIFVCATAPKPPNTHVCLCLFYSSSSHFVIFF